MNQDTNIGKLTTFYQMIDHKQKDSFDRILIPKIQRDYAQGRTNRTVLRTRFLDRLYMAIDSENAKKCELDFIYGQTRKSSEGGKEFLPIDGQQRLTTLFLLHLYISKRAGVNEEEANNIKKFSYETRDSSKQFCVRLNEINPENFIGIKDYIQNQWWYNSRWRDDPTIKSMIVTLDDIDNHYKDIQQDFKSIWDRLKVNVKFWRLDLKDLKTTDDLYIKMNSRGKLLTDFEHFKAQIESYITKDKNKFSYKVDTKWTDLLWDYRDKKNDNDPKKYMYNELDKMFFNIFRLYMIIEETKLEKRSYTDLLEMDVLDLAESVFKDNSNKLERLEQIMDFFTEHRPMEEYFMKVLTNMADEEIPGIVDTETYRVYIPKDELGDKGVDYLKAAALEDHISNRKVIMLEAFFEFATLNEEQKGNIKEKIRIIRNLAFNSDTRNERMPSILKSVDKIMRGDYDFCTPLESDGFNTIQVRQEYAKLKWMEQNHNDNEEMVIKCVENHSDIIGNLATYMEGDICKKDMMLRHKELFHKGANYDRIEKVLLTFGDFSHMVNYRCKQYGGKGKILWKDHIFIHANKNIYNILSSLFNSLTDLSDVSIDTHINNWKSQKEKDSEFPWEYYMVTYDSIRSEKAYYVIKNEGKYDYLMLNASRLSGKHWNPYLFCLHHNFFKENSKLEDYDASLVFNVFEVKADETAYHIKFVDGTVKDISIPQNSDGIDSVDRILLAKKEIEKLLSHASNGAATDEASQSDEEKKLES